METFDPSFAQICEIIGITDTDTGNANMRYTATHSTPSASTAQYRYIEHFDPHTIEMVNASFGEDFQRLGYRMITPDDWGKDGHLTDRTLCVFEAAPLPERRKSILAFTRHA